MKYLKRILTTFSAVAGTVAMLAMTACGGSQPQPNTAYNAPAPAQPTTTEQYGAAMGQPAANPNEAAPSTAGQYPTNPPPAMPGAASGEQQPQQPQYGGTQYGTPPATGTYGGATPGATPPMPGATSAMGGTMADVSMLNDAQLAAIVQAMNQGEIDAAQLAEQKATSPEVKRFAQKMTRDHRMMMQKDQATLSQLQMTPSDNAMSMQLRTDSSNELSTLQGMRGHDFDRSYVDDQVKDHNQALELLDRILPNVKSAQLKADYEAARSTIEAHLRDAERVQTMLQKQGR